jgi:Domain of unknown function (DUF5753)
MELETSATRIHEWQMRVIPGLLQTEEYTRGQAAGQQRGHRPWRRRPAGTAGDAGSGKPVRGPGIDRFDTQAN